MDKMTKASKKYNEIEVNKNIKVVHEEVEVDGAPEKKDIKKVVTVEPKKVKKGLLNRLVKGIVGPEGLPGIGAYVNDEIVKPAIKNIIVDAVTSGINMVMYGDSKPTRGGGYNHYARTSHHTSRTNYTSRYTSQQPEPSERRARPSRYGVEEYIIEDRYDASHVLTSLTENADMYDNVSIADYYDLIGVPSQYTDNQYGWTIDTISRATIVPVRGGYVIKFPPVEVI